jgi:predicted nucleic acid-binding protein
MNKRKVYWDTTCFICFLNRKEEERRLICQDILYAAKRGEIDIWTSTFTIAEVIRPRRSHPPVPPLPEWAVKAIELVPKSQRQIEEIWEYYNKNIAPYEKLTKEQVTRIAEMFEWPWVKPIILDERVAKKAVSIARDYDLKPADSVHAASAILAKVDAIQRWDKDFSKVKSLIAEEEPVRISLQVDLIHDHRALGPHPDDFEPKKDTP